LLYHSLRRADRSGEPKAAIAASIEESTPAVNTSNRVMAEARKGKEEPLAYRAGATASIAQIDPETSPQISKNNVLGQHDSRQNPLAISYGPQKRQFLPALEHISQENGRESDRSQDEAERAERLECGQVSVFHLPVCPQPLPGGFQADAPVGQSLLERLHQRFSRLSGHPAEEPVPLVIRECAQKIGLRNEQFP